MSNEIVVANKSHDEATKTALYSRQKGLLSRELEGKTVVVVGNGAGSQFVIDLAKHGVGTIIGIDFDHVEIHNVPRTAYTYTDALENRPKVECMSRLIAQHNPFTKYYGVTADYCALTCDQRNAILENADMILYLADSFEAAKQANLDSLAYQIPAVFVGIHAQGFSGRIIWQVPGVTNCYRCVANDRFEAAESEEPDLDLDGGSCALADVKLIDAVALKVVLGLLELEQDTIYGAYGRRLLETKRNEIIVRTDPVNGYGSELWDALLTDLPSGDRDYASELKEQALFSQDTVWLKTEVCDGCKCFKQ